nr:hypothetical protein [Enterococcus crotali]
MAVFRLYRDGQWQLGQPGGKWITNITGAKLISGQRYKLMIRYEGKSIKAFLNDQLLYENNEVVYPNTSATIDGDWEGYVGLRLFGNLSKLNVLSMRSGAVGSIPVEDNASDYTKLKEKWKNQLVSDQYDETNTTVVTTLKSFQKKLSNCIKH